MADDKVTFELVSPEALLVSTEADMVVVPGMEGDFGVMPGHAPLVSTVRPGVIDVHRGDRVEQRFFVADGFAEVGAKGCTVLSREAIVVDDIDRSAVEARRKAAEADLRDADDDGERAAAETEIKICDAMLAAVAA